MASTTRSHYSIGDVLTVLQPEFPDVTVSKIRFLESQGLINPERTASGYRKFYDVDVERLRFILKQQKDNFLPLRVIKDRLDGFTNGTSGSDPDEITVIAESGDILQPTNTGKSVSKEELSSTTGLTMSNIDELERFGFIASRRVGGIPYYDENAIHIARLSSSFFRHGVEARHLRVYKNAAEREVAMFEQLVAAKLRAHNSDVRKEATVIMSDLALLGGELRAALVRQTLRDLLGS